MPEGSNAAARVEALQENVNRPARTVEWPKVGNRNAYCSEIYGANVFGLKQLAAELPKPVYASFIQQQSGQKPLDKATADALAHAVRVWAMNRGATHFTHWFQPLTDTTAEKHDSFLTLKYGGDTVTAIDQFSGSQLMQAEPDASSFPNGGVRSTFEARGYTIWDTTSPMFLQSGPNQTMVLYIPSIFISYTGEALDEKTVLLRSVEVVSRAAVNMLHTIGMKEVKRVQATLGTEQEFFFVDRALYALRPDLRMSGRSLIGSLPPKHQQMEDHYFGRIPSRVLAAISEAELELYRLGVPIKTRHNEVAPAQFEMAPIFEDATVAVDHNLLTMDVLHKVAHRHKLKVLFHEKPFKGVNGSGKHCNWSLSTDTGLNLLDPSAKPEANIPFLLTLVATLLGVHRHAGLLRSSIASASNDHRLGANEAPPGIISAFLGDHIDEVCNAIVEGRAVREQVQPHNTEINVGARKLDMKVSTLPEIARDLTDRNRTSPFAFTGNKFEFRAVGSKQSPSFPVTILNGAVASGMNDVTARLKKIKGSKDSLTDAEIISVVKQILIETKAVRFEGNGYSQEWQDEAGRRGLLNIKSSTGAFKQLLEPTASKAFVEELSILSDSELHSRYHVLVERYGKDVMIEATTLRSMLFTAILPVAYAYRKELAESAMALKAIGSGFNSEKAVLDELEPITAKLAQLGKDLTKAIDSSKDREPEDFANFMSAEVLPLLGAIRAQTDLLEELVPDVKWPFPKYTELLFT